MPRRYLAKHPLPIADELLKFVRPRKEWKFEELASSVEQLKAGRSFSNGKQIFQAATCVSCHKFGGTGNEIGPDLTKIDPKQNKPIEILHDLLDPSFRINEKYQTFTFELESGKVITGLVVAETPKEVKVIENPLAKAEPVTIKKSRHRRAQEVAGVDHAQGIARQADARGDSRFDRVCGRRRESAQSAVPGRSRAWTLNVGGGEKPRRKHG